MTLKLLHNSKIAATFLIIPGKGNTAVIVILSWILFLGSNTIGIKRVCLSSNGSCSVYVHHACCSKIIAVSIQTQPAGLRFAVCGTEIIPLASNLAKAFLITDSAGLGKIIDISIYSLKSGIHNTCAGIKIAGISLRIREPAGKHLTIALEITFLFLSCGLPALYHSAGSAGKIIFLTL